MTTPKTISFLGKYYFLITPIIFYSILHLTDLSWTKIALSFSASILLIKKRFVFFLFVILLLLAKSDRDLALEGNQMSSINFQRGDHRFFNQPDIVSKIFHNKIDYFYTFVTHAQNYFSPVALFSSGIYPKQTNHIPIPYLFPWDFFFLIPIIKRQKLHIVHVLKLLLASIPIILLPYGTETSFYMVIPIVLFLKFYIVQGYLQMNSRLQYLVFFGSFVYSSYLLWLTSIYLP